MCIKSWKSSLKINQNIHTIYNRWSFKILRTIRITNEDVLDSVISTDTDFTGTGNTQKIPKGTFSHHKFI